MLILILVLILIITLNFVLVLVLILFLILFLIPVDPVLSSPESTISVAHQLSSPESVMPVDFVLSSPDSTISVDHKLSSPESVMPVDPVLSSPDASKGKPKRSKSKRLQEEHAHKTVWMEDHGTQLFDVLSLKRLSKIASTKDNENMEIFDSDSYDNQKDPAQRDKVIEIMKVTREYLLEQKSKIKSQGAKYARHLSAYGMNQDQEIHLPEELDNQTSTEVDESTETEEDCSVIKPTCPSTVTTRSGRRPSDTSMDARETTFIGKQTFPQISTRNKPNSTLVHPAYLQSGLLMMALGNESPNQVVLNMYIHDTVVYGQQRKLPLRLQKEYQRALHRMKRYRASISTNESNQSIIEQLLPNSNISMEHEDLHDMDIVETESSEIPADIDNDNDLTAIVQETRGKEIGSKAEKLVRETKEKQKESIDIVLPDPRSVRDAHRVASSFLEGEIGKEMVKNKSNYLMPDGTSRAKVGKMAGALVHIGSKVRALKMQIIGKDNRENWADTLIFKLERLSKASNHTTKELYESIRGLVSDAAKVNKGLAEEMSRKLGLQWIPNQIYCCIHTVLGFQEGMVKLWLQYQTKIGADKMYPTITGFELDMEEKCLIKQMLECFMRLTADRWQARSWNRFEAYTEYAKDNGMVNMGVELHGNRFGDLEKCCGIAVYSLDTWINFINRRTDVRNNLAIFLRDTQHLSDICTFLWLGPALLGIHLTEPYLALLLEEEANHLDLLQILPKLHQELNEYTVSVAQLDEPAFPSLKDAWVNPLSPFAPYPKEIGESLLRAIDRHDKDLLERYLKNLCKSMAIILKRQRDKGPFKKYVNR